MATAPVSMFRERIYDRVPRSVPEGTVDRALVDAATDFAEYTRILARSASAHPVPSAMPPFPVPSQDGETVGGILQMSWAPLGQDQPRELEPKADTDLMEEYPGWSALAGHPSHWLMQGHDSFSLNPMPEPERADGDPDDGPFTGPRGQVWLQWYAIPTASAEALDKLLWDDWRQALAAGAAMLLLGMSAREWHNPQREAMERAMFMDAKSMASTKGAHRHTGRAVKRVKGSWL